MEIIKFLFCTSLAIGSIAVYRHAFGKPWEKSFYKKSVVLGIALKVIACLGLYAFFSSLVTGSDALYYYSEVQQYLAGVPLYYRIKSPYSLLFIPFLSLPVRIWNSVGAIVVTMLFLEIAMLGVYVHHVRKKNPLLAWRTAFLYSFSPISVYWIALTGYNGIIIAAFTMFALVLAARNEPIIAGQAGLLGFMLSKLLAFLAWPAIAFYQREGWIRRSLSLSIALIVVAIMRFTRVNPFRYLGEQFKASTSGNVWSLIAQVYPEFRNTDVWEIAPLVTFAFVFLPLLYGFWRTHTLSEEQRFDRALAFVAATNLLFMIVSRKSYTFYLPMALIFIVHTIVVSRPESWKRWIPLAFLGATTTLEVHLFQRIRGGDMFITSSTTAAALFVLDLLTVGCYVYLLVVSKRIALAQKETSSEEITTTP